MQQQPKRPGSAAAKVEWLNQKIDTCKNSKSALDSEKQQLIALKRNIELCDLDEYLVERDLPSPDLLGGPTATDRPNEIS